MKDILIQQKVHKALLGKEKKVATVTEEQWEEIDEIAASTIRLNLSDSVLQNIESKNCKTAKETWETLENVYMSKNLANKFYL